MRYPMYDPQPYTGDLPSMVAVGPSDTRYSSGTARHYEAPFDRRYGRRLAGSDVDVQDEGADRGWAPNELAVLAEADDIEGNGIFDPPGAHPNIHPDAGVFAARFSIPGYHAREIPFSKVNEVRDLTTGRPIIGVPSGAVSLDSAAQIAFIEQGAYAAPQNLMNLNRTNSMPSQSTVNVVQNPQPVTATSGLGDDSSSSSVTKVLFGVALVGLCAGGLYAFAKRGKK